MRAEDRRQRAKGRGQKTEARGQELELNGQWTNERSQTDQWMIHVPGFLSIAPSNLPTSRLAAASSSWTTGVMYAQSRAKSKLESVSAFSPSQSVSLETKCASYRRLAQASRKLRQTEREERRICPVRANLSSAGNCRLNSYTRIARAYAFLYTINSLADSIFMTGRMPRQELLKILNAPSLTTPLTFVLCRLPSALCPLFPC